jgi:hypothetical protein
VHIESGRIDVPVLLASEQVARSPQLQIGAAILNPAPNSLNSLSAASRLRASARYPVESAGMGKCSGPTGPLCRRQAARPATWHPSPASISCHFPSADFF